MGAGHSSRKNFEAEFNNVRLAHREAHRLLLNVWRSVHTARGNLAQLSDAMVALQEHAERVDKMYTQLLKNFPRQADGFVSYASFIRDFKQDEERAAALERQAVALGAVLTPTVGAASGAPLVAREDLAATFMERDALSEEARRQRQLDHMMKERQLFYVLASELREGQYNPEDVCVLCNENQVDAVIVSQRAEKPSPLRGNAGNKSVPTPMGNAHHGHGHGNSSAATTSAAASTSPNLTGRNGKQAECEEGCVCRRCDYCVECLVRWSLQSKTPGQVSCPQCRGSFTVDDVHFIVNRT